MSGHTYKTYDCNNREEYLEMLANDYGVDIEVVHSLADMLGPNEDFDGLIGALEDM